MTHGPADKRFNTQPTRQFGAPVASGQMGVPQDFPADPQDTVHLSEQQGDHYPAQRQFGDAGIYSPQMMG